ncbi:MAG: Membrane lipoprotein TmpC precursor [Candidatus Heimdallarchaeota archaeon LC_2]|nr:MAG: Membrane lipoprotein TmpC precursor [Candidatus Heimdallarchaeota archaeon LC_2]
MILSTGVIFIPLNTITASNQIGTGVKFNQVQNVTIAIVYSTGGLGDLSFNDAAERGINSAVAAWSIEGVEVTVDGACESQCDVNDISANIEAFASSSVIYDLIIGVGFAAKDGITASANAHTDRNFMIIDSDLDLPNVWSVTFKEHEGSFLVGAIAAMTSKNQDIAFLGGLDIPLINRFLAGYDHGAKFINPNITVRAAYSPDPNNPWGDLVGGKTITKEFINLGSDVVFAAAGGTGLGSINGVVEYNEDNPSQKVWSIGVDGDQDSYSIGNVLTSMIKSIDIAIEDQINSTIMNTWTPKMENRGITENGVRISEMTHTQTEANEIFEGRLTRMDKIEELIKQIKNNTIIVREDITGQNILFDKDPPILFPEINSPHDITYNEGDTGNKIEWIGNDNNPSNYNVERDGESIQGGKWISGIPIVIVVDDLIAGIYSYTIFLEDVIGNFVVDTVKVTVNNISQNADYTSTSLISVPYPQLFGIIGFLTVISIRKKFE